MKGTKLITGIVLVAGSSTRYGQNRNKNFEIINGKSVLAYTLEAFDKNKYIDNIIIAVKENEIQEVKEIIKKEDINKKINIIIGGKTRKQSVYNCIKTIDSAIKQDYINKCIENMDEFKGATIGVKSKDTIKITDENNVVINTTNRDNTWIIQTPQCFDRKVLLNVHEKYNNQDVTDDCKLLEMDNYKIKVIVGDYTNIKITNYEDLNIIKSFLMPEML